MRTLLIQVTPYIPGQYVDDLVWQLLPGNVSILSFVSYQEMIFHISSEEIQHPLYLPSMWQNSEQYDYKIDKYLKQQFFSCIRVTPGLIFNRIMKLYEDQKRLQSSICTTENRFTHIGFKCCLLSHSTPYRLIPGYVNITVESA